MEERHIYAAAEIEGDRNPTNPSHYANNGIEPWDAVLDWYGPAGALSHVLGYIARAGKKQGVPMIVDIRKAINWLQKLERWLGEREDTP